MLDGLWAILTGTGTFATAGDIAKLHERIGKLEKQLDRLEDLEGAVATLQASERKAIATAVQKRAWHKQARMLEATDGFRVTE